ncbi:MAG TPA: glycyl-radical enzyme activating protein [bacterium]|nr:glycyl-radical enzyme activating protein [bacterium]
MIDKAVIFNVQRFSTEDGPGIRTTVFFKGCPLKCTWCHNPEGIARKPQLMWYDVRCIGCGDCVVTCRHGALSAGESGISIDREKCEACGACADVCPAGALDLIGRTWSLEELMDEVSRDASFYKTSGGGVTLSGGEVLLQHEFAMNFMKECRKAGLHIALDTSGYVSGGIFEEAIGLADIILVDLKHFDAEKHLEYTGVPLEPILKSAKMTADAGRPVWVRTPVIPGATDSDDNIRAISRFIAGELPNCERYDILPYSNLCISKYERLGMEFIHADTPLVTQQRMEELKAVAESEGVVNVVIQGLTVRGV